MYAGLGGVSNHLSSFNYAVYTYLTIYLSPIKKKLVAAVECSWDAWHTGRKSHTIIKLFYQQILK